MSDQSTILQSIWSKWRVLADADDLRKAQSLKEGDAGLGPAGLWMDESRMPVLLIPTTASATMPDYDESSSLEIRRAQKILDQRSGWFWLISCTDQELLNEFMAFCALVLFKISELGSSRKSIESSIEHFRRLLSRRAQEASDSELLGLFGELHLLNRLLEADPDAHLMWTAADHGRHDFSSGFTRTEVKTSRSRNDIITISSLEQLQAPADYELYLYYIRVEPAGTGGVSLDSLLESVLGRTSNRTLLESMIRERKVEIDARETNRRFTLAVLEERAYKVSDGFPRLAGSPDAGEIPDGVSDVSITYKVDLSKAEAFRIDDHCKPLNLMLGVDE